MKRRAAHGRKIYKEGAAFSLPPYPCSDHHHHHDDLRHPLTHYTLRFPLRLCLRYSMCTHFPSAATNTNTSTPPPSASCPLHLPEYIEMNFSPLPPPPPFSPPHPFKSGAFIAIIVIIDILLLLLLQQNGKELSDKTK